MTIGTKIMAILDVCIKSVLVYVIGSFFFCPAYIPIFWKYLSQFIKVIYYQLKYGLQKDSSNMQTGASALLDDSWLSADSFLHSLCKVSIYNHCLGSHFVINPNFFV